MVHCTVRGTDGSDRISISCSIFSCEVELNGTTRTFVPRTISGIVVEGMGGDDTIILGGAANSDCLLSGDDGNDVITVYSDVPGVSIKGGNGNDSIIGGSGNDTIYGNWGSDTIRGGAGDDSIMGGLDADSLAGGSGNDQLYGGTGTDAIAGGAGNDYIDGRGKADTLHGDAGNDTIYGKAGNDVIYGDDGDDWIHVNDGANMVFHDSVWGGPGNDHADADVMDTVLECEAGILA